MKKLIAVVFAALSLTACETTALGDVLGDINAALGNSEAGALTRAEIDAGLRQALEVGATNVSSQLGAQDGFFGDDRIRIPLPGRLGEVQNELQKVGLSGPLDDLQLRMNRAAEAAMPQARMLMIDVVKSITLQERGRDLARW